MKIKIIVQTETFAKWENAIKDKRLRTITATRITRLGFGLAGDVKPVGNGVSELRIHHGAGYRVYYQEQGGKVIILLCGGDKSSQQKDIETAKHLAQEGKYHDRTA